MKLILFDADGTLVDSQAIIHESMRLTFLQFGYQEPLLSATRSIIGLTLDRAIATILGREIDDEIIAMAQEYKSIYLQLAPREDMQYHAFDGMPELVSNLASSEEFILGVVTGKSRNGVTKLFASHGFGDAFVVSRCADDCPSKPHPAMVLECCREVGIHPTKTIVIGDTSFDMEMAMSAGATAVGVGWGYHPSRKMISAGATSVVNDTAELHVKISNWANGGHMMSSGTMPLQLAGALLSAYYV